MKIFNYIEARWKDGYDSVSDMPSHMVFMVNNKLKYLSHKNDDSLVQVDVDDDRKFYIYILQHTSYLNGPQRKARYVHVVVIENAESALLSNGIATSVFHCCYGTDLIGEIDKIHNEISLLSKVNNHNLLEHKFIGLDKLTNLIKEKGLLMDSHVVVPHAVPETSVDIPKCSANDNDRLELISNKKLKLLYRQWIITVGMLFILALSALVVMYSFIRKQNQAIDKHFSDIDRAITSIQHNGSIYSERIDNISEQINNIKKLFETETIYRRSETKTIIDVQIENGKQVLVLQNDLNKLTVKLSVIDTKINEINTTVVQKNEFDKQISKLEEDINNATIDRTSKVKLELLDEYNKQTTQIAEMKDALLSLQRNIEKLKLKINNEK